MSLCLWEGVWRSHDSSMCATVRDHVSRWQFSPITEESTNRAYFFCWINSTTSDKLTFCRISLFREHDLTKRPFFLPQHIGTKTLQFSLYKCNLHSLVLVPWQRSECHAVNMFLSFTLAYNTHNTHNLSMRNRSLPYISYITITACNRYTKTMLKKTRV